MAARSLAPARAAMAAQIFDQSREIFNTCSSAPDFNQRSDQPPYHLPQKMRSRDSEPDQMFISCDFGGLDVDDRRLPVSFRVALAECGEIMTAHNQFGRACHLADLQPVLHPPDIFFAEGRAPRRDLIKVAPSSDAVRPDKADDLPLQNPTSPAIDKNRVLNIMPVIDAVYPNG